MMYLCCKGSDYIFSFYCAKTIRSDALTNGPILNLTCLCVVHLYCNDGNYNIQKHFVITTVDKAINNFAVICKIFYISKIKEDLGIRGGRVEGNDVYAYCIGFSPEKVVDH